MGWAGSASSAGLEGLDIIYDFWTSLLKKLAVAVVISQCNTV